MEILQTNKICDELDRLNCIEPWDFEIKTNEGTRSSTGLFRVSADSFAKLSGKDLKKLRDMGALQLLFLQRYSMNHLPKLQLWQGANERRTTELERLGTSIFDQLEEPVLNFDFEQK